MARPKTEYPTPGELEVLKILWEHGPQTVRDVMEHLKGTGKERAYTSVMSLMNVMADKKFVKRKPLGRAFVYESKLGRDRTLGQMVGDLWHRAFEESTSSLVTHLLEQAEPSRDELAEIRRAIDSYLKNPENSGDE